MHLLHPAWLLLLVGVALLVGLYIWFQLRKPRHAVRFTNLDLLDQVAPDRPGKRRHVVAAVFAAGLVLLIVSLAQPVRTVEVPNEMATVVLAFDTSLSMMAEDVEPNRLEAAQAAAAGFVAEVPAELDLGLVTFDAAAVTEVEPTADHQQVVDEINDVELEGGTAIGDAVVTSVDAVEDAIADAEVDPDSDQPPGAVVLISDGAPDDDTVPIEDAIAAAQEAGIPVSTIAFGTDDATITNPLSGEEIEVDVDEETLQQIADETGGTAFDADSAQELDAVYADIGSTIGYEEEERDISRWFLGAGLITFLVCAGLSLAWSSRIL
jgi:Ca-activated chloride channel family protein